MLETDQMWASMASWFTPTILFCFLNFMIATIFLASNFRTHHPQEHSPSQLARAPSLLNRVKSLNFPFYNSDHHYPFASQPQNTQEPTSGFTSFSLFREERHGPPSELVRTPSLLERVQSITRYSFSSQESYYPVHPQPQIEQASSGNTQVSGSTEEEQQRSVSQLARAPSLLERVRSFNFSPYNHTTFQNLTQIQDSQPDSNSSHHVARSRSDSGNDGVKPEKKMKKSASVKGVKVVETDEDIDRRRPATVRERKVKKKETASEEEEEEKQGVDAQADDFINKFKQQLKLQRLDSMLRFSEMLGRGT